MVSMKRIRANRRNAKKSTGPKTVAGKKKSRMNALKHGLDAETLILPGEDPAAFRARLDAWRTGHPPRNRHEEELLEQAARLSWRLDRADRALDAYLAERLAHDEDLRRQRGEAEAVEAAAIGERLLAGPPLPTYDLDRIQERLDRLYASEFWSQYTPVFDLSGLRGKRLARPVHPDAPEHPAQLLRRLESTTAGCAWLLDRWAELRTALEGDAGWSPDERLCAVRLLSEEPADAVDDPMVQTIYLCAFVLGSKDPQVFGDQSVEMIRREFEYFLERWEGRRISARVPASREEARAGLRALVDGVMEALEERAAGHAERAAAEAAAGLAAFDGSAQEDRLRRLQLRIFNALMRTVDLLMDVRRRPTGPDPGTASARNAAASPGEPKGCGKLRNEPTADPCTSGRSDVGRAFQPDSVRSWVGGGSCRRSDPIGPARSPAGAGSYKGTRSDPGQAGEPDRRPTARPDVRLESPNYGNSVAPAGGLATTPAVIEHCEKLRNEPNANPRLAAGPKLAGPMPAEADGSVRRTHPGTGRGPGRDPPDPPRDREDAETHSPLAPSRLPILLGPMSGLALTSVRG
jgi:hypothetical protein